MRVAVPYSSTRPSDSVSFTSAFISLDSLQQQAIYRRLIGTQRYLRAIECERVSDQQRFPVGIGGSRPDRVTRFRNEQSRFFSRLQRKAELNLYLARASGLSLIPV